MVLYSENEGEYLQPFPIKAKRKTILRLLGKVKRTPQRTISYNGKTVHVHLIVFSNHVIWDSVNGIRKKETGSMRHHQKQSIRKYRKDPYYYSRPNYKPDWER